MRITVDDSKLRRALVDLVRRVDNPARELDDIGDALASNIRANLGRGLQYDGAPMQPLKIRKGLPLNNTHQHIYNRITHQVVGKNTVVVGMLDSDAARIGRVHQFGATIRAKNARFLAIPVSDGIRLVKQVTIPRRPFLPLTESGSVDLPNEWRAEMLQIMQSALADALRV